MTSIHSPGSRLEVTIVDDTWCRSTDDLVEVLSLGLVQRLQRDVVDYQKIDLSSFRSSRG
jgi:hypothetical protein